MINTLHAQNPAIRVFEDWSDTSGTQNDFQRTVVRSKAIGGTTYYYVCGATLNSSGDYDILTRKLDASGNELWTQTYSGSGNGDDYGADIQIDNVGNVYVCGLYYKDATDSTNAIILKYNAAGTYKWAYTYNGTGSRNDVFATMQVSANAVIAGGTTWKNSTNKYDFLMARLDSNGTQIWLNSWDYLNLNDAAVNVYNNGSKIYIAGGAQSATTTYKYAALNVRASDGAVLGNAVTGGTAFGIDQVTDLKVDANQNIYITGSALDMSAMYDIRTIKLDTALNILWSHSYDGGTGANDFGSGVTIDQSGNVIVCGTSQTSSNGTNYVVLKYNSSGTLLWDETYNGTANGNDSATAVVVHPTDTNKIYVTGYSFNGSTKDYYTLKYDAAGTRKWEIGYNNIYNGDDRAFAITLDTTGNVIVTGQNKWNDSTYVYTTVKYVELEVTMHKDTTSFVSTSYLFTENRGQLLGSDTLPHPEVKFYTINGGIQTFYTDTAYTFIHRSADTSANLADSLLRFDVKYLNANAELKVRSLQQDSSYYNFFQGHIPEGRSNVKNSKELINVNVWNNVDVIHGSNVLGLKTYFICKPVTGGNSAAAVNLIYEGIDSLVVESNGDLTIHTALGILTHPQATVWQLDANGDFSGLAWQPSYSVNNGNELKFTNFGSFNTARPLIISMDWGTMMPTTNNANLYWSTFYGAPGGGSNFKDIKVAAGGDRLICGTTATSAFEITFGVIQTQFTGLQCGVILRFNNEDEVEWATFFGGNNSGSSFPNNVLNAIEIDKNDDIFVTGWTNTNDLPTIPWGAAYFQTAGINLGANTTNNDAILAKIRGDGQQLIWSTYYGGASNDVAWDVAIASVSPYDLYIAGSTSSTNFPFPTTPAWSTGNGFFVHLTQNGVPGYGSYVGNSGSGVIKSIAIDQERDVVFVGEVGSGTDLPITQPTSGNIGNSTFGGGATDGFILKLDKQVLNPPVIFCTYFGGGGGDALLSVVANRATGNNIRYYISGTSSSNTSNGIPPLVDPGGGAYFQNTNNGGFTDALLLEVSNIGNINWATYYGGNGGETGTGIAIDLNSNIYSFCHTESSNLNTASIFPNPNLSNAYIVNTRNGQGDMVLAVFRNTTFEPVWGTYYGGSYNEGGEGSVACDQNNSVLVVGANAGSSSFPLYSGPGCIGTGTPYFDNVWGNSTGGFSKAYIAEFCLDPVLVGVTNPLQVLNQLLIYPNPANELLTISNLPVNSSYTIDAYTIHGQLIYQNTGTGTTHTIETGNWNQGVYVLQVRSAGQTFTCKLIVQR